MADTIGLDMSGDCRPFLPAIAASPVKIIGRYYRSTASSLTPLTFDEAVAISQADLSILALWEWTSDEIGNFSSANGKDQGTSAYNQARNTHQPAGTPIYFAVDGDFSAAQIAGPIADYFTGVAQAFDLMGDGTSVYQIGVYGSGLCCSWLLDHQLATYTWLAGSTGWQQPGFANWDVKQGFDDFNIAGLKAGANGDYDTDLATDSAGAFQVAG